MSILKWELSFERAGLTSLPEPCALKEKWLIDSFFLCAILIISAGKSLVFMKMQRDGRAVLLFR